MGDRNSDTSVDFATEYLKTDVTRQTAGGPFVGVGWFAALSAVACGVTVKI
ncbi:MAG: hypothetical protein QOI06_1493 [Nocardioidaceae bacterium]|jgi:hypothetical protein|nr:hypothetical protein [Nocardioidaceae bacterium]